MNDDIEKVELFDSFSAVHKILGWTGYYRALNNPARGYKWIFNIYSVLAYLLVVVHNIQHLTFIALHFNEPAKLIDSFTISIPLLGFLIKVTTGIVQESRIRRLNSFLKEDTTFRAYDEEGQKILKKNKRNMINLFRVVITCISIGMVLYASSFIVRRYNNPEEVVPSYVPFAIDTWARFFLTVFFECGLILWIDYGHICLDILVGTYYASALTQVKIIKQQLEIFVGTKENSAYLKNNFKYKDLIDENVAIRFISIVRRYEKLIWYKDEIGSIFNVAMSFQFISYMGAVCFVIYSMSGVSLISIPFLFLVVLYCVLILEVFLYCYFANELEFESRSINNSLYNSDWISLSPSFRRQMLIAMVRWSQPIEAKMCSIVPLSLNSLIAIVKTSYTLYTVLVAVRANE